MAGELKEELESKLSADERTAQTLPRLWWLTAVKILTTLSTVYFHFIFYVNMFHSPKQKV
jgi:hypothetical protein